MPPHYFPTHGSTYQSFSVRCQMVKWSYIWLSDCQIVRVRWTCYSGYNSWILLQLFLFSSLRQISQFTRFSTIQSSCPINSQWRSLSSGHVLLGDKRSFWADRIGRESGAKRARSKPPISCADAKVGQNSCYCRSSMMTWNARKWSEEAYAFVDQP